MRNAFSNSRRLLYDWAGYKPQGYPLALIEPLSGDNTVAAKEPQIKTERDVPILNSFYIQDLESAAISLITQKGKPIDRYLSDNYEKRILLESEEGAKTILDTVRPEKTPSGRWPDRLSHQQSLMQQFAINATFDSLKTKDVFSVNGPPGTGKTSLLREIIAENIVARAKALPSLKWPKMLLLDGKPSILKITIRSSLVNSILPSSGMKCSWSLLIILLYKTSRKSSLYALNSTPPFSMHPTSKL